VCNEVDPGRRSRLQSVLLQYLPATARRRVRVTGHDAVKHFSTFDGGLYDRVLLDAPCSSDRHVVAAALEGAGVIAGTSWSLARVQQLAKLQTQVGAVQQMLVGPTCEVG
jgi:16S rRNA C967 or C1407 C5-methylase (RsmB/RsmF family)